MLDRFFEAVAALLLSAITLLALVSVVARYMLDTSLAWSSEILIGLLVYATFFCGYLALRQGAHLRIDVLVARLSRRSQWGIFFVNQALIGMVALIMTIWGLEQTLTFSQRTTLMLGAPRWLFYMAVPISGAGMLAELIRQCALALRIGKPPYQSTDEEVSL